MVVTLHALLKDAQTPCHSITSWQTKKYCIARTGQLQQVLIDISVSVGREEADARKVRHCGVLHVPHSWQIFRTGTTGVPRDGWLLALSRMPPWL